MCTQFRGNSCYVFHSVVQVQSICEEHPSQLSSCAKRAFIRSNWCNIYKLQLAQVKLPWNAKQPQHNLINYVSPNTSDMVMLFKMHCSNAFEIPVNILSVCMPLMSTHDGGCARGHRRRFSCRQLVAALSATAPFLSQLRVYGTVYRSLWHLRRHYWRSGGSWRQRCLTAPTSDSSLTAICFCFLLDIVTCPCSFIY